MKYCKKCKQVKDSSDFNKDASKYDGLHTTCRACECLQHKQSRKKSPEKARLRSRIWHHKNPDKAKNNALKRKFGLTIEAYKALLVKQHNNCAICGISGDETSRKFAVDHCHHTSTIRGLLCDNCNKGLGMFKDSINNLEKAISYLGQYHGK